MIIGRPGLSGAWHIAQPESSCSASCKHTLHDIRHCTCGILIIDFDLRSLIGIDRLAFCVLYLHDAGRFPVNAVVFDRCITTRHLNGRHSIRKSAQRNGKLIVFCYQLRKIHFLQIFQSCRRRQFLKHSPRHRIF